MCSSDLEREMTLGFVDLLRDDFIEKDRARGIFFTQDWASSSKSTSFSRASFAIVSVYIVTLGESCTMSVGRTASAPYTKKNGV